MWEDILQLDEACREKFITEQDFPELAEHGFRMGGASVLRGTYVVGRREPDIHTLVFGVSGQGKAAIPGASGLSVLPGDCLFLPAGQPFRFEIDGAEWQTCWLLLPDSKRWAFLHERPAGVTASEACWSLYHLTQSLYHQMHSPRRRRLIALLADVLREEVTRESPRDPREDRLRHLFSQIEDRLHVPWTLHSLAAEIHYSPSHLHRLCQTYFACSPMQKLSQIRLAKACELLQYTQWQVRQIAQRVGYSDPFNFTHWFRRSTGLSPTAYRLAHTR